MNKEVKRKCRRCGQAINPLDPNEDYFFVPVQYELKNGKKRTKKNYYHTQCYFDYYTKFIEESERISESECLEKIEHYKGNYGNKEKRDITADQFHYFLEDMYCLNTLPSHFYITLDKVYTGIYKNMRQPIPIEHLFDMWKRKKDYLNKVRERKRQNGEEVASQSALFYDLAILVGQYDSYLEWKNNKLAEMGNESISDTSTLAQTFVPVSEMKQRKRPHVKPIKQEVDILAMLDEI